MLRELLNPFTQAPERWFAAVNSTVAAPSATNIKARLLSGGCAMRDGWVGGLVDEARLSWAMVTFSEEAISVRSLALRPSICGP